MGIEHFFRPGNLARANGPHRLVANGKLAHKGSAAKDLGHGRKNSGKLALKHGVQLASFALVKGFANAEQHLEAVLKGKNCFAGYKGIILAHDVPPLGMPGQHPACASVKQHGGRSFARKSPFFCGIAVLSARRKRRNALESV